MRNRWIMVSLVSIVLTLGILGGTVLAQDAKESSANTITVSKDKDLKATRKDAKDAYVQKLAAKLGIAQSVLQEAMDAVAAEQKAERQIAREKAFRTRLNKAVEAGKMTQEQADAYQQWTSSKPAISRSMERYLKHDKKRDRGKGRRGRASRSDL